MLNGIGGRTIAEAKHRMSYAEFLQWVRYRNKRGSLNTGLRHEYDNGHLMSFWASSKSKKRFSLYDFTPHIDEPEIGLDDAMEAWK